MAQVLNEQFIRMQKLAGVITEGQYRELAEQQLEEGWKEWLLGGLITLSAAGGIGKVVQMNRDAVEDKQKTEMYYDKVLAKAVQASDSKDLVTLANQLIDAKKLERPVFQQGNTAEQNNTILSRSAENYMRKNPQEFSVSLDGKTVVWTPKATT